MTATKRSEIQTAGQRRHRLPATALLLLWVLLWVLALALLLRPGPLLAQTLPLDKVAPDLRTALSTPGSSLLGEP